MDDPDYCEYASATYIYIYIPIDGHIYAHIHIYLHIYIHIHIYISFIFMFTFIFIFIFILTFVFIFIFTFIFVFHHPDDSLHSYLLDSLSLFVYSLSYLILTHHHPSYQLPPSASILLSHSIYHSLCHCSTHIYYPPPCLCLSLLTLFISLDPSLSISHSLFLPHYLSLTLSLPLSLSLYLSLSHG